jgi:hypothetical protein
VHVVRDRAASAAVVPAANAASQHRFSNNGSFGSHASKESGPIPIYNQLPATQKPWAGSSSRLTLKR